MLMSSHRPHAGILQLPSQLMPACGVCSIASEKIMRKQNKCSFSRLPGGALMNEIMRAKYRAEQHTQASCYASILPRPNNPTEDESGVKGLSDKANMLLSAAHLNFLKSGSLLKYVCI